MSRGTTRWSHCSCDASLAVPPTISFGALVRVRRLGDSGPRLLPVRQQVLQQPRALRPLGRFVEALLREARTSTSSRSRSARSPTTPTTPRSPGGGQRAVPIMYPKLQQKYGDAVTYVQARSSTSSSSSRSTSCSGRRRVSARRLQAVHRLRGRDAAARTRVPRDLRPRDEGSVRRPDRAISTYRYAVSQISRR